MHCVSLRRLLLSACWVLLLSPYAHAHDWYSWRGPEQTGVSREKDLPAKFSTDPKDPNSNLVWKAPFGARSTPIVMNGRVYLNNQVGEGVREQERVMCFDANNGKVLWERHFSVYHTDIVSVRLGWTNLAGDPETDRIYWQGTQGEFVCFDRDGKTVWQRQLTEQDGRISGYGGRLPSPVVDKELVIIGMINSSWGDQAKPANRFLAMDKRTGTPVWWSEPSAKPATYYSTPIVAVINGQRLLLTGCSDGAVHALNFYTGQPVWNYPMSQEALNASPVVHGSRVYMNSGGENLGNNIQGRIVCLDAAEIADGKPKLVWQKDGINAKYTTSILHDDTLYVCDDIARLHALDAKDGKPLWKKAFAYGRNAFGSPVWADGKIFVSDVNAKFHILQPGPKKCEELHEQFFSSKEDSSDIEIKGNPAVANGRVYFATSEEVYCIGKKDSKTVADTLPPEPKETPLGEPAQVQLRPYDITLQPGEGVQVWVHVLDKDGRDLHKTRAEGTWSLPAPPPPPNSKATPPALKATLGPEVAAKATIKTDAGAAISGEWRGNTVQAAKETPSQQGMVLFDAAKLGKAKARVRVAPRLPYAQDFDKMPDGASPAGWVNANGKLAVVTRDKAKVLAKNNTKSSPLFARGNAYIGLPGMSDYTIDADVMGTKVVLQKGATPTDKGKETPPEGKDTKAPAKEASSDKLAEEKTYMPDVGIVNSRYTLALWGNLQRLRLTSWEAIPRVDEAVDFKWEPGVWYRMKLAVTVEGDKVVARGKVWKRDDQEPKDWTVQFTDPTPNREGAPALYGYITGFVDPNPGNEIYYDNVRITPNGKGP